MKATRKRRKHLPRKRTSAVDFDALRAEVLAAHRELSSLGIYPGLVRLAAMLHRSKSTIEVARYELMLSGEIEFDDGSGQHAKIKSLDDPSAEIPDDPDAAEIEARIAEARAVKEAEWTPPSCPIRTAKFHRPARKRVA